MHALHLSIHRSIKLASLQVLQRRLQLASADSLHHWGKHALSKNTYSTCATPRQKSAGGTKSHRYHSNGTGNSSNSGPSPNILLCRPLKRLGGAPTNTLAQGRTIVQGRCARPGRRHLDPRVVWELEGPSCKEEKKVWARPKSALNEYSNG